MSRWKVLAFAALAVVFIATIPSVHAQVGVGINIGVPPVCPYGYFDHPPYDSCSRRILRA